MLNKPTEWALFTLVCKTNLPLSDKDYDDTFSVPTAQFVVKGRKNQIDENSTYLWWMLMYAHLLFYSVVVVFLFFLLCIFVLLSFWCFDFAVHVFVSVFLIDSPHFVKTNNNNQIDENTTYLWWMLMCVHLLFCLVILLCMLFFSPFILILLCMFLFRCFW